MNDFALPRLQQRHGPELKLLDRRCGAGVAACRWDEAAGIALCRGPASARATTKPAVCLRQGHAGHDFAVLSASVSHNSPERSL